MAAFIFIQPIVGLAAGHLALGEPVGPLALAGAFLILVGVTLEARRTAAEPSVALSRSPSGAMSDCFVCRKHSGEIVSPGGVVYEDELVYSSHMALPEGLRGASISARSSSSRSVTCRESAT